MFQHDSSLVHKTRSMKTWFANNYTGINRNAPLASLPTSMHDLTDHHSHATKSSGKHFTIEYYNGIEELNLELI